MRRPRRARFLHQSPRQTRRRGPRRSQGAAPGARRAEGRWTRIARARRFRRPVPQRAAAAGNLLGGDDAGFSALPGQYRGTPGGPREGGWAAEFQQQRGAPEGYLSRAPRDLGAPPPMTPPVAPEHPALTAALHSAVADPSIAPASASTPPPRDLTLTPREKTVIRNRSAIHARGTSTTWRPSTPFARGSEPPCRRSRSTRRPRAPWTGRGSSRWGDTRTVRRSRTPARTRERAGSTTFAATKTTSSSTNTRFITNTRSSSSSAGRGGPMISPRCPLTPGRTPCSGPRNTAVGERRRGWTRITPAAADAFGPTRPRIRGLRSSTRRCPAGSGRASFGGSRTRGNGDARRVPNGRTCRRRRRRRLRRTPVESPRRCRATKI